MRSIRRHLVSERGLALPIALGMSMVLGISLVVVLQLASTGARHSERSQAQSNAYAVAEAGVNVALSILGEASDPTDPTLLPSTTVSVDGGEVTYSGTYVLPVWTITSTGRVANPVDPNSPQIVRTLNQKVTVQPLVPGATPPEWDRLFHDRTDVCLTIDTVTIPASVTSRGDLCLVGTGKITNSRSKVEVGDDVTLAATADPTQSPNMSPDSGSGWTSSNNIASNNGVRASSGSILIGGQSANLNAWDFDFAIPSNAVIEGIRVRVQGYASGTSLDDEDVYLLRNGSPIGITDHASGTDWPQPGSAQEADRFYGGSSDLWGTTWTPAEINNNAVNTGFGVRLRVDNDAAGLRTAFVDWIEVEVFYHTETVNTSIGLADAPGSRVARAEIVGTCAKGSGPANTPCSAADNVFADTYTTTPPNLVKPQVDMAYWYQNAKPGPMKNCDSPGVFPGGFDIDTTYNKNRPGSPEITPALLSYTCQVRDAQNNLVGELSWNHVTHVLKIHGTIFIDGDVRFDDDGQLVNYQGRGILYAAGDIEYDEVVCAGGDGTNNCHAGGMSGWDPEQNMMIILSGGWSEYDQGQTLPLRPAAFQGVMYAQDHCLIHQDFKSSGPIICDEIRIQNTDGQWPDFYAWPELQTLIAGQMYGSFAVADDYTFILGEQTG